jgi:hypothetical protein
MIKGSYAVPMECGTCKSTIIFVEMDNGVIWTACPYCRWIVRQEDA